ncbi:GntR family transcriptional regulator [bacterium]|nr:GntR family transcriptional regulator [bacterium]
MFERKPLRNDVAAEILGRIIDGRLPAGSRINESTLATELGISRTPLREAMLCLTSDGALAADMGRGFRVPHLSGREVSELLEAVAVTAGAAMRGSAEPDLKSRLEAGNILSRARIQLDAPASFCEQFYLLIRYLTGTSPNRILRQESLRLCRLTLRYLFEGLTRGLDARSLLEGLDTALGQFEQGRPDAAADAMDRTLRDLARELAARFPAEVAGRG